MKSTASTEQPVVKSPAWVNHGAADGFVSLGGLQRAQGSFVAGPERSARPWLLAQTKIACAEQGG